MSGRPTRETEGVFPYENLQSFDCGRTILDRSRLRKKKSESMSETDPTLYHRPLLFGFS